MRYQDHLMFEAYKLHGLGHGKTVADLSKKHGVSVLEIKAQLEKGIKTEREHTQDDKTAEKIAMDHLTEDPHYYDKLAKIEKQENEEHPIMKAKREIGANIMRMVKYGMPQETDVPEMKQKLMNIFTASKKAGGHFTEKQIEEAKHLINQLRNFGMPEQELRNLYKQAPAENTSQEDDEMPYPVFAKLSQHAAPTSSKEKDATDAEIHDLATPSVPEEQQETKLPTLRQYYKDLDKHDYYYQYSDDGTVYSGGQRMEDYLKTVADQGGPAYKTLYKQMVAYHTRPQGSSMQKPAMPELSNADKNQAWEKQNEVLKDLESVTQTLHREIDADWVDPRTLKGIRNAAESVLNRVRELAVQKNIKL